MNEGPNARKGPTDQRRQFNTPRNNDQPDMSNRNVIIGRKTRDNLENSGGTTLANPTIEHLKPQEMHEGQNIYKTSGNGGNTSVKGSPRKGLQNVTITETSNRFVLLNEEGHELESDMGTGTTDDREDINLVDLNTRWVRKQERNLNISYSQTLNQDQRIEAKRYVIQEQLPEPETLGVWPKQLLNYFKQLCHLYNYGEGFCWASYVGEEELDVDGSIAAVHSRNGEEVESESDATASFMKEDNFNRYSAYSDGKTNEEGVEQVRMDLDMAQAETVGSEINGS
ncbi:hypothetical protein L1987_61375 [Smallanthus sonchifolius]|uniref:Uncharacterized protein n=1 Tax=Smallanthus sonchifolius TaxID=185202 RepID=A0ACB9DAK2_9ASTR|nr:hypothetical protein L1987_61375 [Smallanthus sonchifolius]